MPSPGRISASGPGVSATVGMLAARAWLAARGIVTPSLGRWHATVLLGTEDHTPAPELDERVDTRFRIEIYAEEWGYFFCHGGRASWIRVTDIPFVHGRDDFGLLATTPTLDDIGLLLRETEALHRLHFRRDRALVETNLANGEAVVRSWVQAL